MRWTSNLFVPVMAVAACVGALAQSPPYGIGRAPTAEETRAWDISITPDGKGLPPGSGTAKQGTPIYAEKCALCHGPMGEKGNLGPALVGGKGTLASLQPVK